MTKTDIMKDFLKKAVLPVVVALFFTQYSAVSLWTTAQWICS